MTSKPYRLVLLILNSEFLSLKSISHKPLSITLKSKFWCNVFYSFFCQLSRHEGCYKIKWRKFMGSLKIFMTSRFQNSPWFLYLVKNWQRYSRLQANTKIQNDTINFFMWLFAYYMLIIQKVKFKLHQEPK